ncbi:methyl-accepting chemotaxis protein [Natrinema soli]|uniref:Methyl-accepting chemotaxis protein n=1 Tax=Natrinema soli TaxID=1930624 RepID=A0ABD5SHD5_9EURY|nr:methyl-accepting chemotaxis protein [Natrinema soli]
MEIETGVQSNVYENHGALALHQSEAVSEFHDENRRTLSLTAGYSRLNSSNQTQAQTFIDRQIEDLGGGNVGEAHLHFLETDGSVIASSMDETESEISGEWVDKLDQKSGTYASDVYRSGYDGSKPRVAYVTDQGEMSDGTVLVYTVPLTELPVTNIEDARTVIVDSNGTIAFDEREQRILEPYDEDREPLEKATEINTRQGGGMEAGPAGGTLAIEGQFDGQRYVVGYAPVPGTDWVALVHTPTDQAYGFVEDVRLYGTLATIGAVLLIGLVGAGIGRNTSRSIDRLTDKAGRMEDGELDVDLSSPRIDSIGQLYDGFDNMRNSLKTRITEANEARDEAERARSESERINEHLERKADEYSDVMQAAAGGDLTARMHADSENEAMAEIAAEFNEMIAELETTTASVKAFASDVATASEQVTASSEEVHSASQQVTESIQEISDGAVRQNDSLQTVNQEMGELSTTTEEIAASSNEVAGIAERTARAGKRGREAAQKAIAGMNEIETGSAAAVEEIEQLQIEVEQIDDLLEFITEIAEQTNMLALNANIEASRTESSDDGFAVVAGEVKDLAAETKEAAGDIEDRLERIKEQTERTADEVEQASDRVAEHTDAVGHAVEALDQIAEYAETTNDGVQEISAATEEQAASTQEVVAMVDDAAVIAEETSSESETVAAAAEEQTTSLTEVSRSADELASQAAHLSETLDYFETERDADADVDFETTTSFESAGDTMLEFDGDLVENGESAADGESDESAVDGVADESMATPAVADADGDGEGDTGSDADGNTGDDKRGGVDAFEFEGPDDGN